MRSNHAGETGAVCIYRGILRITRDPGVARFAKNHLATEERHLSIFEAWLPKQHRSCLLPLWRLAGYLLGMIAAGLGPRWVFTTIDAVENFVVAHYEEQILRLSPLVGPARLHPCHYKCTVYFDKTIRSDWPIPFTHTDQSQEVVYIDHDHLIRCAGPQTN